MGNSSRHEHGYGLRKRALAARLTFRGSITILLTSKRNSIERHDLRHGRWFCTGFSPLLCPRASG